MYDGPVQLIYYTFSDGSTVKNIVDTYAKQDALKGQGFNVSFQKGINNAIMLKVRSEDFEESKHLNTETNKMEYATQISFDNAVYDIVWTYQKDNEYVELTCG
jgi:hypothetical protein